MSLKFSLLTFFYCCGIFSQQNKALNVFHKEVNSETENLYKTRYFEKVRVFFLNKNWDSTLVYSSKGLHTNLDNHLLNNYFHLFRGYSFKEKRLFTEAVKEFELISDSFIFYNSSRAFLGDVYLNKGEFEKALSYYLPFVNIDDNKIKGIAKSSLLHNLGLCFLHLKNFKKAEIYLKKSLSLYVTKNDTVQLIGAYGDIATLYYEQYKDDIAIPYFQKAYQLAKHVKKFKLKQNTAKNMAVVEENRKDLTAALAYRKEYEQWRDSLNNQNKIWETAQLEKKFAVEQKQHEVNILKAENRASIAERNGLLYSAGILLLLLLTGLFFYREKTKTNRVINTQNKRLDDLNATKDRLFSIVSHDLRSSVNTLKLSNKKLRRNLQEENITEVHRLLEQNSNLVGSAYNLLDNLLNWSLLQTKQSYFEIQELHLFYVVEQLAYNYMPFIKEKKIYFENTISKKIKVLADQESLKIILRNLLDNAIKFSNEKDQIKVYNKNSKKDHIDIVVEDSGVGMTEEMLKKLQTKEIAVFKKENEGIIGSGLGLQLCKAMIEKNKGELLIHSELRKGTKMIVSLPKPLIKNG